MKIPLLTTQLLLGLGLSTALVAPLAIVVACGGSSSEATPTPTVLDEEATAQKAIVDAPTTLPANAPLSERVLFQLKVAVKEVAGATPLANYIASNKPSFENSTRALKYEKVLMPELNLALGLSGSTKFEFGDFMGLLTKLGLDAAKFTTSIFEPATKNYDGQKSDATSSWAAQIKFWNFVFDPANRYANLVKLLKTNGLITDLMLIKFDKVIATPLGQASDVDDASGKPITGFGGKAIFNQITPTEVQYQVRSAEVIRKSISGGADAPQIDLGQLNNIFEVYTAIAYALKIKEDASRPIATFWPQGEWGSFSNQMFSSEYPNPYIPNITFKLGNVVSAAPTDIRDFEAAINSSFELAIALRATGAEPQVRFEASDWIPANDASNMYGEDMLTNAGFGKVWSFLSKFLSNPIVEALTFANSEYSLRVLGMLAALSPAQFNAYGELLTSFDAGLKTLFARLGSTIQQAAAEAKFASSDYINLWEPTRLDTKITKENLRIANFFIKAFTKQFDGEKYVVPAST